MLKSPLRLFPSFHYKKFEDQEAVSFEWPERWFPISIICQDDSEKESSLSKTEEEGQGKIFALVEEETWVIHCVDRNTGYYSNTNFFNRNPEGGWVLEVIAFKENKEKEVIGVVWTHEEARNVCEWIPAPEIY